MDLNAAPTDAKDMALKLCDTMWHDCGGAACDDVMPAPTPALIAVCEQILNSGWKPLPARPLWPTWTWLALGDDGDMVEAHGLTHEQAVAMCDATEEWFASMMEQGEGDQE